MEQQSVLEYYNRTVERLAGLLNKQAIDGESHHRAWLTKKLIEDNKLVATLLKNELENPVAKNELKSASY